MTEFILELVEFKKGKRTSEFLAELGNRVINEIYIKFDENGNEIITKAKLARIPE